MRLLLKRLKQKRAKIRFTYTKKVY